MGSLTLDKEGEITISGPPPYGLPEEIDDEFVEALFAKDPGEPGFIGELALNIPKDEKMRLRRACKELRGSSWTLYCQHASRWAGLVNPDNVWHMEDFVTVYEAEISRSASEGVWAHRVIITTANIRFVETPRGLFTFPEFQWHYGQNIVEYIAAFQAEEMTRLEEVKEHISSELLYRNLTVVDPRGNVVTQRFAGLASKDSKDWRLPKGYSFMADAAD